MNKDWGMVLVAALFEVVWVIGLKHAYNGWTWLGTAIAIYVSFAVLIRSSQRLPVGTVYAVFTGIGTAGTVTMEMLVFGEPFHLMKISLILLLLCGVIGLKLVTSADEPKKGANR